MAKQTLRSSTVAAEAKRIIPAAVELTCHTFLDLASKETRSPNGFRQFIIDTVYRRSSWCQLPISPISQHDAAWRGQVTGGMSGGIC